MITLLILSLSTCKIIVCQTQNISQQNITDTFSLIKSLYNTQQFSQVWSLFGTSQTINEHNFVNNLTGIYNTYGPIAYDLYIYNENITYVHVVAYKNSLQLGIIGWEPAQKNGTVLNHIKFVNDTEQISLLKFCKNNSDQFGLSIFLNGIESLGLNKNRQQPIDSMVTIPIVLEFSRQVQAGRINPKYMISIGILEKFFIPQVEQLFTEFLEAAKKQDAIQNDKISLEFIAWGMTYFGSPALTEYLQGVLGLKNIDNLIKKFGLNQTQSVYQTSTDFAFHNFKSLQPFEYMSFIQGMNASVFYPLQKKIHKSLVEGKNLTDSNKNYVSLDYNSDYINSAINKWQVRSTSLEYANMMNKISQGKILKKKILDYAQQIINPVKNLQVFEKNLLLRDSVIIIQTRDLYNAVGYAQLISPISGVSNISFALFVQGVTVNQYKQIGDQLDILLFFLASQPNFIKDFAARLNV